MYYIYEINDMQKEIAIYDENKHVLTKDKNAFPITAPTEQEFISYVLQEFSEGRSKFTRKDYSEFCGYEIKANVLSNLKLNILENVFRKCRINLFVSKGYCLNPDYAVKWKGESADFQLSKAYYPQPVTCSQLKARFQNTSEAELFSYFLKDSRTKLITGQGGIGKTELLKHLFMLAQNHSIRYVYAVSLSYLLKYSLSHPIAENKLAEDIPLNGGILHDDTYNSYLFQLEQIKKCSPQMCSVWLLDGLNELLEQKTNTNATLIHRILQEIQDLCASKNCTVILTSRTEQEKSALPNTQMLVFEIGLISEQQKEISRKMKQIQNSGLAEKIRIPMYYCLYAKLEKAGQLPENENPYSFLKLYYLELLRHSIESKNLLTPETYSVMYLCFIPLLAHRMESFRTVVMSVSEVCALAEEINSEQDKSYLLEIVNQQNMYEIVSFSSLNVKIMISMLKSSGLFRCTKAQADEEEYLEFIHQDWREFACEFFVLNYLAYIRTKPVIISNSLKNGLFMPTFNLLERIQNVIAEQSGISRKIPESFSSAFPVQKKINFSDNYRTNLHRIESNIHILYTAFELYDHFRLHFYDEMYALSYDFAEFMMELAKEINLNALSQTTCIHYGKTLSALMECLRREHHDYQTCEKLYAFAMNDLALCEFEKSNSGEGMLAYRLVLHEMAKAKLAFNGMENFDIAYKMLLENKMLNLSANLLGCMQASPNQMLLEKKSELYSLTDAFSTYYEAVKAMTSGIYRLNGTELVYTSRQLAALCLKGYLLVDASGNPFLNSDYQLPDKTTLVFCEVVLNRISGQKDDFLKVLEGIQILTKINKGIVSQENTVYALYLLETMPNNSLSMVVRLSKFLRQNLIPESSRIFYIENYGGAVTDRLTDKGEKLYSALKNCITVQLAQIGQASAFDATDVYYYLADVENFIQILYKNQLANPHLLAILEKIQSDSRYQKFQKLLKKQS
ncbi:MAG: hypothetical protein IJJ69_12860 [Oscillospiraceae bacterium]|nr:hypothetical protein [Oscillospiraceae bacterium]